jgi:hypothetical protein
VVKALAYEDFMVAREGVASPPSSFRGATQSRARNP